MLKSFESRVNSAWVSHSIFCTFLVVCLYYLENAAVYQGWTAHFPFVAFIVRWFFFFLLGLPLIILYERYVGQRFHQTEEASEHQLDIIRVLNELLADKSPMVEYHAKRTAALTRALCDEMGLSQSETRVIVFAAMFHDIGKLFLDSKLLVANPSFSEQERKLYNTHPMIGEKILSKIREYSGAESIVRHHHESWDGKGFPEGLSGENIPLGARIISIADNYDALTNGLDTGQSITSTEALEELKKLKGIKYDPYLVDVFEKIVILKQKLI